MQQTDAYAVAAYIEGSEQYPPRWQSQSRNFRENLGPRAELDLKYGKTERQVYDVFRPEGASKGVLVFVHGGFWKSFDNKTWSYLAQGPVKNGWTVVMPGYDLCPNVRVSDITRQVAAAIEHMAQHLDGPISLCGHSAGGHLVCRMLDPDVLAGSVRDRIKTVVPISPLSDLRPLLHTDMNDVFGLDDMEAAQESPVLMSPPAGKDVAIWVGSDERPAFLDQACWLAKAWGVEQIVTSGENHFDIIDALVDSESRMTTRLCKPIG